MKASHDQHYDIMLCILQCCFKVWLVVSSALGFELAVRDSNWTHTGI